MIEILLVCYAAAFLHNIFWHIELFPLWRKCHQPYCNRLFSVNSATDACPHLVWHSTRSRTRSAGWQHHSRLDSQDAGNGDYRWSKHWSVCTALQQLGMSIDMGLVCLLAALIKPM